MLTYEYREIPAMTGEVGGDAVYLGTPTGDAGKKLPRAMPTDTSVDAGDGCPADEVFVDPSGATYAFVTWNVTCDDATFNAYTIDDLQLTFTGPTSANTTATAWYVRLGDGDGPPAVACYALDRVVNRFFRRTPIESAVPPNAWPGGQSRVLSTSEGSVKATAVGQIAGVMMANHLTFYSAIETNFTQWRLRKHAIGVGDPLALARGDAGVAVAVYEQDPFSRAINTLPYELFKLLRGGTIDLAALRRFLTTPASDGPGWGGLDLPRLTRGFAELEREHLERVHRELRELNERSRTMVEIVDRVMRG